MAKEYTAKPTPDTTEDQNALTTNEAAQVLSPVAGKPQRLIYCGPNLSGGFLQRYMVSKGGLPIHLDSLFASCPAIKSLFVPVADLAKTEKAIANKGTPENSAFGEVLQFTRKGGK